MSHCDSWECHCLNFFCDPNCSLHKAPIRRHRPRSHRSRTEINGIRNSDGWKHGMNDKHSPMCLILFTCIWKQVEQAGSISVILSLKYLSPRLQGEHLGCTRAYDRSEIGILGIYFRLLSLLKLDLLSRFLYFLIPRLSAYEYIVRISRISWCARSRFCFGRLIAYRRGWVLSHWYCGAPESSAQIGVQAHL